MKNRSLSPMNGVLALLAVGVAIAAVAAWNLHQSKIERAAELSRLAAQTDEYAELKRRWSTKESGPTYAFLRNHPNKTALEKRGGKVSMRFENLSAVEFNRIANRLLNSTLAIKKLSMQRNAGGRGTIVVEFES